jgi:hypothetical protein
MVSPSRHPMPVPRARAKLRDKFPAPGCRQGLFLWKMSVERTLKLSQQLDEKSMFDTHFNPLKYLANCVNIIVSVLCCPSSCTKTQDISCHIYLDTT